MKKSMRTLLSLLVALALLVSLPISALAEDNNKNDIIIDGQIDTNDGMNVDVATSGSVQTNTGVIDDNYGSVNNNECNINSNYGTVDNNNADITLNIAFEKDDGGYVENTGIVKENGIDGKISVNGSETGKQPDSGIVTNNDGKVNTNYGTVETNSETGIINNNAGLVGSYEEDGEGNPTTIPDEETGNKGTIGGNTGNVVVNDGTIYYNGAVAVKDSDDFIKDESAQVESDATVQVNKGSINENYGFVDTNEEGGTIIENYGTVSENSGTIDWNAQSWEGDEESGDFNITAQGVVDNNSGFVEVNDGIVTNIEGGEVKYNNNIVNNKADGKVLENYGIVNNEAGGKVLENYDTVNNKAGGEVLENYDIVNNEAGGVLNDVVFSGTLTEDEDGEIYYDNIEKDYKPFTGEKGTYCATFIEIGSTETIDEATGETSLVENVPDEGVLEVIKQSIKDSVMDLKEVGTLFNREGYEVIGYETDGYMNYSGDSLDTDEFTGPSVVYETTYKVTSPGWLRLVWGKSKGVIVPPPVVEIVPETETETETEEYTIPNYVIAKYVREGTVIQRGTHLFKVIAVEDGTILVASMGRLNQADLDDMMGFLAKYFSEAQLERLIGEPELLSEELTEEHFGDELEHICFRATANLFEG